MGDIIIMEVIIIVPNMVDMEVIIIILNMVDMEDIIILNMVDMVAMEVMVGMEIIMAMGSYQNINLLKNIMITNLKNEKYTYIY